MNAYEKVQKILTDNPDLPIGEAVKKAKVPYHKYSYFRNKALGIKRKSAAKPTTRRSRKPQMETIITEAPAPRKMGGLIAFVGSKSEVVAAVKELLRGE